MRSFYGVSAYNLLNPIIAATAWIDIKVHESMARCILTLSINDYQNYALAINLNEITQTR
jgi:hypothetical protein